MQTGHMSTTLLWIWWWSPLSVQTYTSSKLSQLRKQRQMETDLPRPKQLSSKLSQLRKQRQRETDSPRPKQLSAKLSQLRKLRQRETDSPRPKQLSAKLSQPRKQKQGVNKKLRFKPLSANLQPSKVEGREDSKTLSSLESRPRRGKKPPGVKCLHTQGIFHWRLLIISFPMYTSILAFSHPVLIPILA